MTTKALGICIAIVCLGLASNGIAQDAPFLSRTRRPVIRGLCFAKMTSDFKINELRDKVCHIVT
jgi:hypothetical protein